MSAPKNEIKKLKEMRDRLNAVSPSFCLAKWKQVTLHLQNGQTHSCHHPPIHPIPLSELKDNPSALHNTQFKKEERRQMLAGKRPAGCDYCWNIEDMPGSRFSDRTLKSKEEWAAPYFDEIKNLPADANVLPSYLEVSFSHACNFKCAYCSPHVSSKWLQEILQYGPYPTTGRFNNLDELKASNRMPLPEDQPNPYQEAFWKWWPDLYPSLRVMRITGGEPLLSPHTMRTLDYIEEHPHPALDLSVNSNLGVSMKHIERLTRKVNDLLSKKKIKSFCLYTSIDTYGNQAEYIRYGMKFEEFRKNIEFVLDETMKRHDFQVSIMCTYNVLSVTDFRRFLEWNLELKKKYTHDWSPIALDVAYLRDPAHMNVKLLPAEYIEIMRDDLEFMIRNSSKNPALGLRGFQEFEWIKFQRLVEWASKPADDFWLSYNLKNFAAFVMELDRRRGTDFSATFPEMTHFFESCKKKLLSDSS